MKSFHIVLPGHELGETLGAKNIEIARSFGLDAHLHPGVRVAQPFKEEFAKYGISKWLTAEMQGMGQQGCFLAHFQLWQKCVELNEPIVICEHDGEFLRPLPEDILKKCIDILRLEPFSPWKDNYEEKIQKSLDQPITYKRLKTYYKTYYAGHYGYIITPSGAQKLINYAQTHGVKSVDRFVDIRVVDIKSVTQSVVRLDSAYSGKIIELSTTARRVINV